MTKPTLSPLEVIFARDAEGQAQMTTPNSTVPQTVIRNFRNTEAQEDGPIKIPEVIAYKSTAIPESQWKSRSVDEWLKRWLDDCDYHESLVYEAIIQFCDSIRNGKAITRPQSDELRQAAEEAHDLLIEIDKQVSLTESACEVMDNLRAALEK